LQNKKLTLLQIRQKALAVFRIFGLIWDHLIPFVILPNNKTEINK